VLLPIPVRRRLAWLTQATFTVGVTAVVLNERDEMLLLRHRFRESQAWELPGGFVERGETLEEAIHREIREETRLSIEIVCHLATHISRAQHVDVSYLARISSGAPDVDDLEILEARFFPLQALPPGLSQQQLQSIRPALRLVASGKYPEM
jgi:ADP-ribose pyrophosphatase YjhB (NUDIX family)